MRASSLWGTLPTPTIPHTAIGGPASQRIPPERPEPRQDLPQFLRGGRRSLGIHHERLPSLVTQSGAAERLPHVLVGVGEVMADRASGSPILEPPANGPARSWDQVAGVLAAPAAVGGETQLADGGTGPDPLAPQVVGLIPEAGAEGLGALGGRLALGLGLSSERGAAGEGLGPREHGAGRHPPPRTRAG